jgi:hypothetical protein
MVILGGVLVAGGSALVVCSAIFWAWSAIKQKLLRGPDEGFGQTAGSPAMMKSLGMVLIGGSNRIPACGRPNAALSIETARFHHAARQRGGGVDKHPR